jgi:cobalt/nickel transport system permease protein
MARLQKRIAPMPDYNFTQPDQADQSVAEQPEEAWPAVDAGASTAGVLGGLGTLLLVIAIGYLLRPRPVRKTQ